MKYIFFINGIEPFQVFHPFRAAALNSIIEIVSSEKSSRTASTSATLKTSSRPFQNSLLVLQCWLEQFSRTNGGNSLTDYAAESRVRLLQTLQVPNINFVFVTYITLNFISKSLRYFNILMKNYWNVHNLLPKYIYDLILGVIGYSLKKFHWICSRT